jgi:hypothetical protein
MNYELKSILYETVKERTLQAALKCEEFEMFKWFEVSQILHLLPPTSYLLPHSS